MKYILLLENGSYNIKLNSKIDIAISDLEQMLDNMVNLCKMYDIDDEEILNGIIDDMGLEVEKNFE